MTTELVEKSVSYVPLGMTEDVRITVGQVRKTLAVKTRSGKEPSDNDIVKFMMLCKSRRLNPWVGDCYLIGYDTPDGPVYSLITSFQAFLKRAELSEHFDGLEGGVIVQRGDDLIERPGELVLNGETLVGAWARGHRKDHGVPTYVAINRRGYDKARSLWKDDPGGMLVKCAKAKALREMFPTELGGLHVEGEVAPEPDQPQAKPKLRQAFAEPVVETANDTSSAVACSDCGTLTPPDLIDDGRCPECFRRAERPE